MGSQEYERRLGASWGRPDGVHGKRLASGYHSSATMGRQKHTGSTTAGRGWGALVHPGRQRLSSAQEHLQHHENQHQTKHDALHSA